MHYISHNICIKIIMKSCNADVSLLCNAQMDQYWTLCLSPLPTITTTHIPYTSPFKLLQNHACPHPSLFTLYPSVYTLQTSLSLYIYSIAPYPNSLSCSLPPSLCTTLLVVLSSPLEEENRDDDADDEYDSQHRAHNPQQPLLLVHDGLRVGIRGGHGVRVGARGEHGLWGEGEGEGRGYLWCYVLYTCCCQKHRGPVCSPLSYFTHHVYVAAWEMRVVDWWTAAEMFIE